MKRSELKKIIQEEVSRVLGEDSSTQSELVKFSRTTLTNEPKGYYWIFTNSNISNGVFRGNINDEGGHGKRSSSRVSGYRERARSRIANDLKDDQKVVNEKLKLLQKAIDEFNQENKTSLRFTYTLNKPEIRTSRMQGDTVYSADSLVASVIIK